jgi:hypothetical protein
MFRLFNRQSEQDIIKSIHNEIDTSAEKLLSEAKKIISDSSLSDKAKRMKSIGFINSEVVKEYDLKEKSIIQSSEQAKLIEYYQQKYPFQKFLTIEELDRICAKYGLVYAQIKHYLKDVPEKNLREIELSPKLNPEDKVDMVYRLHYEGSFKEKPTKEELALYRKGIIVDHSARWMRGDCFRKNTGLNKHQWETTEWTVEDIDRSGLFIAAPKSHFNLTGLTKTSTFSFNTVKIDKDPIVFRYCRGGIQVLTKWGLEANDESLVNPKTN